MAGEGPSGREREHAPSSVSGKGVLGKGESHHKNNPFSALATATKKSAGAVKGKLPPHDLGSAEKAPHKELPAVPPQEEINTYRGHQEATQVLTRHCSTLTNQEIPEEHRVAV